MKTFYRVAHKETRQGVWYDSQGNFTGLIHNDFSFCKNRDLKMPFDKKVVGFLSATETLQELLSWFPEEDIRQLEMHGFFITRYETREYKKHNNHWLICQEASEVKGLIPVGNSKIEYKLIHQNQ